MPGPRAVQSVLTGMVGGGFSGLTGVGGGAVMVPLLTGPLRLSQHRAHGTSLAIIVFVAIAGAFGYWRAGNIDWRLVAALTPGAVIGVYAGAKTMMRVPAPQLRVLFGLFLLTVAFRQLVWEFSAGSPRSGAEEVLAEVVFGLAGGLLAGMLGVGGGAIFVPAIVIFGLADPAVGEAQQVAQGVSLAVIVATALAGTATNLRQGAVDIEAAVWIAPAAIAAGFAASVLANRLDADVLRRIYGVTALGLGAESAWSAVRAMRARP